VDFVRKGKPQAECVALFGRSNCPEGIRSFWNEIRKIRLQKNVDLAVLFEVGKSMYWHRYLPQDTNRWKSQNRWEKPDNDLSLKCMHFYCESIQMTQKSIFLFLFFWQQQFGVRDVGKLIAQLVWEDREILFAKFE
jgi:hypothetical protein